MEPKLFIATKALIAYEGKILLLRESGVYQEGTNAGRFDVPGGRLKLGERFDEALRREVFEETGLEIEIGRPIAVSEWRPVVRGEQWQIVGIFFECRSKSAEVSLGADHNAYLWIRPEEYPAHPIIDNLKSVFAAYAKQ